MRYGNFTAPLTAPVTAVTVVLIATGATGCFDEPTFNAKPQPSSNVIFFDGFPGGVDFQAFANTNQANPNANALSVDTSEHHSGRASLRVVVPGVGDPSGTFAGGAFVAGTPRDLSTFNALDLFVKGSRAATFDVLGVGNDNTGTSTHIAERHAVPFGADWTEVVIPFPDPSKLTAERGLFHFAEGADGTPPTGYTLWLDDIQFVHLSDAELGAAEPSIKEDTQSVDVGATATVSETQVHFAARPADEIVAAAPGYFTFASSDEAVATVDAGGVVTGVAPGSADVTATMASVAATGALHVTVAAAVKPTTPAPVPSQAAADAISLYSDAFTNVAIDTWRADWSMCGAENDETIGTDNVKHYAAVQYVGVEFIGHQIDATAMTTFHVDIWTPDSTLVKVKLVDFGADGAYQGGDDSEHELTFTTSSTPPLVTGDWMSLDLPLSSFTGLHNRAHLAQLIFSATSSALYVDNVYFHR